MPADHREGRMPMPPVPAASDRTKVWPLEGVPAIPLSPGRLIRPMIPLRHNIAHLSPYVPGRQPTGDQVIKLNTNENPCPPSSAVMDAIAAVTPEMLRRYPQADAAVFRQAAAELHGLQAEQVIATNGGDELLRLAITALCRPRADNQSGTAAASKVGEKAPGGIVTTCPTYALYSVLAEIQDTPVSTIDLEPDFSWPADMVDRITRSNATLALLVNPHAPSGLLRPIECIRDIARAFSGVVLVDEAYVDFASEDGLELVRQPAGLENVLLLRSLSKGYSLAGLRFGYGLGSVELIAALHKVRDSYNVDVIAQHAAIAALKDQKSARSSWQLVCRQREWLRQELEQRGIPTLPSESNFLLAEFANPAEAESLLRELERNRILVRYFREPRLDHRLRITVGNPEQNEALLRVIDTGAWKGASS